MMSYNGLENVIVTSGILHPDGWITQHLRMEFRVRKLASGIKICLFNPDISPKFSSTNVRASLNNSAYADTTMKLGAAGEIVINSFPRRGSLNQLTLDVSTCLVPDRLDDRERATLLLSVDLIGVRATIARFRAKGFG